MPPLVEGHGGLPKIVVAGVDGASFEAYLHGAQITSWCPANGGGERLFMSEAAHFAPGESIRGGVPVCFPQFADQGPLPMHGFVRVMPWSVVSAGQRDGAAHALFRLTDDASTRALWPHAFACELEVTALARSLTIELRIGNTGADAFDFTMALHTYLRVQNVRDVRITGFSGAHYRDKVLRQNDVTEQAPDLAIDRPIDRVYRVVPQVVELHDGGQTLQVRASGTTDTVVWNPGPPTAATPADLAPNSYSSFVCIEAAVASAPQTVAGGQTLRLAQMLTLI